MLAIAVEFLHGTFRGDPDGTANTGRLGRGEWPPSPARLFAALVAADGTGDRCRVTDGRELKWLEQQPPPEIYASTRCCHQQLNTRFVAKHGDRWAGQKKRGIPEEVSVHQEYVGRTGVGIRPGVRVALSDPRVVYRWDEVDVPDGGLLESLRLRAARVGFLGTSDSPARLRVHTRMPPSAGESFVPDDDGDVAISVTRAGHLKLLDRLFDEWVRRGASVARSQFPALKHEQRYRSPGTAAPPDRGKVVAWLQLDGSVSGRRITTLVGLFKAAVLSQHERIHGEPHQVLHGHGFRAKGYEIARYLALPNVGYARSDGRIHGLALWLPPGPDPTVRRRARDAALAVRRLTGHGLDVAVERRDEEAPRPVATKPTRWLKPSRAWATATPAIHERRRTLDLAEVTRWCRHAGLPAPIAFRSMRTPLAPGAIDLAPVEVNRPGKPKLPYSHVEIRFAEPVDGPVVIGSGRQRGFGLCVPVDD